MGVIVNPEERIKNDIALGDCTEKATHDCVSLGLKTNGKKWNGESWRDYRITENVCVRENEKNLRGYPNKGMVQ